VSAEIPDGAVLVARAIVNSSLWTMRPEDCKVAITCISLCNSKSKKWFDGEKDVLIPRGSFVRSWGNFVKSCALPLQVVRTSVQHLVSTDFLTRYSTRGYTVFTLPKYEHYQDLTKYSDSVMLKTNMVSNTPLTTNNNIPPNPTSSLKETGGPDSAVVVVEEKSREEVLEKVSHKISIGLLESVKMAPGVAAAMAGQKTVGQVLRAVQQARLQKKPGGWARMALEGDWTLPPASDPELSEVVREMRMVLDRRSGMLAGKVLAAGDSKLTKRLPDEDEASWFRRVNDELRKRKQAAKPTGRENRKRAEKDSVRPEKTDTG